MEKADILLSRLPARRRLYEKAARRGIPLSGTFELTPLCNMNCKMCYIRMTKEEMDARGCLRPAADWLELGRQAVEQGMLFVLLTGGEPLLRPDFAEIYLGLSKMGLGISINTNGTMIDEKTMALFAIQPPARVNVTLYGASNETYARLCGNPHGFDQAMRGLRLLKSRNIPTVINASFTPQNVGDMQAIYETAASLGLTVRPTAYMFPPTRSAKNGETDESARLTPQQAGEALYMTKVYSMSPEALEQLRKRVQKGIPPEQCEEDCTRSPDEPMGCMAGRCAFWVTWDGRMTPCGMMNDPAVLPFRDGFAACWQQVKDLTAAIRMPPACTACPQRPACTVCGALAKAEGRGDSTQKPEYLCGMTEAYVRLCHSATEG